MSLFALVLLGSVMWLMSRSDPQRFEPGQELVGFTLAAVLLAAVSFLTGQLGLLRGRLKAQKTELAGRWCASRRWRRATT